MAKQSDRSFKVLKKMARGKTILFVHDSQQIKSKTQSFFERLFNDLYMTFDTEEAAKLYQRYHPDIVVADLTLADSTGFAVVEAIKSVDKDALILVLSSSKKTESLIKAIDLTVFQYLIKPLSAYKLSQALIKAILVVDEREQKIHFEAINEVFHFQDTMMVRSEGQKLVEANKSFLSFFGVESLEAFTEKYTDIIDYMIAKDVWVKPSKFCTTKEAFVASDNPVFNIRMHDAEDKEHHLFLSVYKSFNGQSMILSFKDVTHFNFLPFFELDEDRRIMKSSIKEASLCDYLRTVFESGAKIKFRNFYKGLPIIRQAELESISYEEITLRANPRLFRAIDLEHKTRLESAFLPQVLMLDTIEEMDESRMSITFKMGSFVSRTAITRQSIRLEVEENHLVALFKNETQLEVHATIIDISIEAVKLQVKSWDETYKEGDSLEIDMVLNSEAGKSALNAQSTIYTIEKMDAFYEVVLTMNLEEEAKAVLQNYLNARQVELNREFKALI